MGGALNVFMAFGVFVAVGVVVDASRHGNRSSSRSGSLFPRIETVYRFQAVLELVERHVRIVEEPPEIAKASVDQCRSRVHPHRVVKKSDDNFGAPQLLSHPPDRVDGGRAESFRASS